MRGHRASTLDDAWRETILCLVGEALESGPSDDEEDEICGAVVSVRAKADRIRESRFTRRDFDFPLDCSSFLPSSLLASVR